MPCPSLAHFAPLLLATGALLAPRVLSAESYYWENGLWASIQSLPSDFEYDDELSAFDEDFDGAARFALGYRFRAARQTAFIIQAGLAFSSEEFDDSDTSIGSFGLIAEPGVNFRFGGGWGLDLAARLGAGFSGIETDDGDDDIDEDGAYVEWGVLLRPDYRFHSGWRIFFELGYLARYQGFDIDDDEDDFELTIDSQGATIGFGGGYTF